MKFSDKQVLYIENWIKKNEEILKYQPKVGDLGLKLQNLRLKELLAINKVQ
jgi:hypothetical protein